MNLSQRVDFSNLLRLFAGLLRHDITTGLDEVNRQLLWLIGIEGEKPLPICGRIVSAISFMRNFLQFFAAIRPSKSESRKKEKQNN